MAVGFRVKENRDACAVHGCNREIIVAIEFAIRLIMKFRSIRCVLGRYDLDLYWPGRVEMDIPLREGNYNTGLIEKHGDVM